MIKGIPIWDGTKEKDCWRLFRNTFQWDGTSGTKLRISVESTYEVWLNGKVLPIQQLADSLTYRTYTVCDLDAFLLKGENTVRVLVHWNGQNFSTSPAGTPYLLADISAGEKRFLETDKEWQVAESTTFRSGACRDLNGHLGFGFEYDARKNETDRWKAAVELVPAEIWETMVERTVPLLTELPPAETEVAQCGFLRRENERENLADTCQTDWLASRFPALMMPKWNHGRPKEDYWRYRLRMNTDTRLADFLALSECPGANGYYIIADLGTMMSGYVYFKLTAPEGTIVDVLHGEHLDSGRVRANNGFNLADRYICKEGENEFCYRHRRFGCRYIELHLTNVGEGRVFFSYVGLIPVELPLPAPASFCSEDRLLETERALCIHTMKNCMHEHYEDTPWREQALYAYDARQQMLYGYYTWGNYDFAAASLDLLGRGFDGDRNISMTAPSQGKSAIPIFTMVWMSAICEHYLYSGTPAVFLRWEKVMDTILDRVLSRSVTGKPGLYSPGSGKKIWNFCEWNGSLSRMNGEMQAPFNLYLAEALQLVAQAKQFLEKTEDAKQYRQKFREITEAVKTEFWDEEAQMFLALPDDTDFYEHIQVLALKLLPLEQEKKDALYAALIENKAVPLELSALRYMVDTMMEGTPETQLVLQKKLQDIYAPMLKSGSSGVWETRKAAEDFQGCATHSHAWGAVMPYWIGAYLLGIRPLEPGFARYTVQPVPCGYSHLSGEIPTPRGKIQVSWTCTGADETPQVNIIDNFA